jgi:hypothetical protein
MTATDKTNCKAWIKRVIRDLTNIHVASGIDCNDQIQDARRTQTQINNRPVSSQRRGMKIRI